MTELFLAVAIAVHLIAVNFASAAPLVCIWMDRRAGRGDKLAFQAGKWLAVWAIYSLLIGVGLGLIGGWVIWSDEYRHVLNRLASKIYYGVWELLFSFVLMAGYVVLWRTTTEPLRHWRWLRSLFAFLASTNLLYHFPFLMFVMARLVTAQDASDELISPSMFRQLMIAPDVLANSFHFLLAAIATSGMGLIVFALRFNSATPAANSADVLRLGVWGARIALVPTLLQIPVGMWVFAVQPVLSQANLMGGSLSATGLLVVGILAALSLMNQLTSLALGEIDVRRMQKAVALFVVVVLLMTGTLRQSRVAIEEGDNVEKTHSKNFNRTTRR